MYYDLHTHTDYSDGSLRPEALVARAHAAGVKVLALTDHDCTDGIAAAAAAAAGVGLTLVPGVEISVTWQQQTIHVLGLGVAPAHAELQAGLAALRVTRGERAHEIGARLAKAGVGDAYAGAAALAGGPIVSRTHFARHLVASGHARDLRRAFKQFLTRGAPGYAPVTWVAPEVAIDWIHAAGGQAVLAHPARYKLAPTQLRRLLAEFKEAGGDGIEVISGSHSRDDMHRFALFAREFGFLASAGSDYHGPDSWLDLGALPPLPAECAPVWRDWPASA